MHCKVYYHCIKNLDTKVQMADKASISIKWSFIYKCNKIDILTSPFVGTSFGP